MTLNELKEKIDALIESGNGDKTVFRYETKKYRTMASNIRIDNDYSANGKEYIIIF